MKKPERATWNYPGHRNKKSILIFNPPLPFISHNTQKTENKSYMTYG